MNWLIALMNAERHGELEIRVLGLLEWKPECGFLWKLLSKALKMQGKDALKALRSAARFLPQDAEAHTDLGNTLQQLGQNEGALIAYRQALAIRPDDAHILNNTGNAWRGLGQLDRAVASYRKALQ